MKTTASLAGTFSRFPVISPTFSGDRKGFPAGIKADRRYVEILCQGTQVQLWADVFIRCTHRSG